MQGSGGWRGVTCGHHPHHVPPSSHIQGLFNPLALGNQTVMKQKSFSSRALALLALGLAVAPLAGLPIKADAQNGEQGQVRKERKAGNILSSRQIEKIVLPRMNGMQYIGPEYDPAAMAYRLKFIENGKVYYVDVDARTGRIIGQSH